MSEVVPDDILEHILVRLDVDDLVRCTSVCKYWHSFISHHRFIQSHLSYIYKHCDFKRRIILSGFHYGFTFLLKSPIYYLIGSSNGLICVCTSSAEILVANPSTRQVRILPLVHPEFVSLRWSVCSGFGYDSSLDDYMVLIGFRDGEFTRFQVFSLKSNAWKDIGQVKYEFVTKPAVLCNGALHWVMFPHNDKKAVILAFDLSRQHFEEIPQPDDDPLYQSIGFSIAGRSKGVDADTTDMSLGIIDECLCVFPLISFPNNIWTLKNYNVSKSWERLGDGYKSKLESINIFNEIEKGKSYEREILLEDKWMHTYEYYINAPAFVRSLVSPTFPVNK